MPMAAWMRPLLHLFTKLYRPIESMMFSDTRYKLLHEKSLDATGIVSVRVTEKYFKKDPAGVDKPSGSMRENDVIIAPGIPEQMATNNEKATSHTATLLVRQMT